MKKILISAGTIAVVAALAVGGTIAFYNDSETSTGNIFTAGSIDLKVDHTLQTYNGVDCKTCSVDVYSSTATKVVAASAGASNQGPFPVPAVDVSNPHSGWQNEAALAPAQWIWATNPTTVADTTNGAEYTFENKFQWNGTAVGVDLDLALAGDNGYKIILNGTTIVDKLSLEFTYNPAVSLTGAEETAFMAAMVNGLNTLDIVVRNKPLAADPVTGNPAGLLFKLNIHRDPAQCAADSAFQQVCRLWTEKDLGQGDTFFSFGDVKPADWGTNVISLHVSSNDAYACLITSNKDDQENTLLSPEIAAGDALGSGNPNGDGELSNYLNVFTWGDTNGNGVYNTGETALGSGSLSSLTSIMSMDSGNGQFLTATTTKNIGLVWCAGTLVTPTPDSAFVCNGSGMGNIAQSDSFSADLTAYAEQVRNNENFSCSNVQLASTTPAT
jgi:predicted ribosomally synthesized peptide with SipW-like signal peptide